MAFDRDEFMNAVVIEWQKNGVIGPASLLVAATDEAEKRINALEEELTEDTKVLNIFRRRAWTAEDKLEELQGE